MANAEMKIFEAEKLHQPMIVAVKIIPNIPLKRKKKNKQDVSLDYINYTFSLNKCSGNCVTPKVRDNLTQYYVSRVYEYCNVV